MKESTLIAFNNVLEKGISSDDLLKEVLESIALFEKGITTGEEMVKVYDTLANVRDYLEVQAYQRG